jgi:precorrin-2 dehydrogenase/sirohydrochlorin ferrochelatase
MGIHGVFLRLVGRRCVIIGSDEVAVARAGACVRAGAHVTLVGPADWSESGVERLRRPYENGDLAGAFLAYATVRDSDTIARIRAEAVREGVLLNVVDVPDACDFFAGAVIERDPLTIVLGTGGRAPGALAFVRRSVEEAIGPEYGAFVTVVGALRDHLRNHPNRADAVRAVAGPELLEGLRTGDAEAVDRLLTAAAGSPCSLAHLGVSLDGDGAWA